jgi:hypothetical protein
MEFLLRKLGLSWSHRGGYRIGGGKPTPVEE